MTLELQTTETDLSRLRKFFAAHPEVTVLSILIAVYLFVANYLAWPATFGTNFLNVSGGSDPYYNYRVITYFLQTKHYLLFDPAINYPVGTTDPRNPFFEIFVVFIATLASPFYNVNSAATFTFLEFDALFGALLIIPVYLISKEIFGIKAGILAAVLYTLMPSNLSAGILSDGRMHTPELLFAFFTIYFVIKSVTASKKSRIAKDLNPFAYKTRLSEIRSYFNENRLSTIYALLGSASLGALMLSWQGYAYIEAIVGIYFVVQLMINLITKRPTGYITYLSLLFFALAFVMSFYYYDSINEISPWYKDGLYIAVFVVFLGILVNFVGRRPWLITLPLLIIIGGGVLVGAYYAFPSTVSSILAGEGYFIKTRVYQTIAEAAAPPLGEYISGFGVGQFLLGLAGLVYTIYLFFKKKTDTYVLFLVFSLVSIYMSFAAARFNITAAPAYAAMGGAILAYFAALIKTAEIRRRTPMEAAGFKKSVKGNLSPARAGLIAFVVMLIVLPSGFGMFNAAVPQNNAPVINQEIYNSLPSFIQPLVNYSSSNDQFVGTYGFGITNSSTPLNQALTWLATQNTNVPLIDRPAFVSWWDYGFQELIVGQHPTVADDFQQGFQATGQMLLAQNQSQIVSLFIARVLEGSYDNNSNSLPLNVYNTMVSYLGSSEASFLYGDIKNPGAYINIVLNNPSVYGKFISGLTSANAMFAVFSGSLSSKYSLTTLNNLYSSLIDETGYNIQYVTIDHNLFPISGTNPGIFYAPEYLTDKLSYSYQGEIVPYPYYQIYAITSNATYQLNQTPTTAVVTGYNIAYCPDFYNSTIYRFTVGYPPSVVGSSQGIPGLTVNRTSAPIMPAWNMSNFEIVYANVPWNPYTNYQNHTNAFKLIPIQTAYQYEQEHYGTSILLPTLGSIQGAYDPIVAYYPGAIISGRVTTPSGQPVPGAHVTLFDQYGIPHDVTITNFNGYYCLIGVPGNDSIYVTEGRLNSQYLIGASDLNNTNITVTQAQAERLVSANSVGGISGYKITENFIAKSGNLTGNLKFALKYSANDTKTVSAGNGTLKFTTPESGAQYSVSVINSNYSLNYAVPGTYNVSFLSDGKCYENFTSVSVNSGSNSNNNLQIRMDRFQLSVFSGNYPLNEAEVFATSPQFNTTAFTNSTGISNLFVPPGNYTIYTKGQGFISNRHYINFASWGLNASFTVSPVLSSDVSGKVLNSNPSTIYFYRSGQISDSWNATVRNGKFSIDLPDGYYTVYASKGNNVFASSYFITNNTTINISLQPAYNLNLSAYSRSTANGTGFFEVISDNALLISPTSKSYNFTFNVPGNVYSIAAEFKSNAIITGSIMQMEVLGNYQLQLPLNYKANVSIGTLDNQFKEFFPNTGVVIEYQNGLPIFGAPVTSSGTSFVIHAISAKSTYQLDLISPGFEKAVSTLSGNSTSVGMVLTPYKSTLNLYLRTSVASNSLITATLNGVDSYVVSISNGTGSCPVFPGVYSLSLFSSSAAVNAVNKIITVPVSTTSYFNSAYTTKFSIISSTGTPVIFNQDGIRVNQTALSSGQYTVYVLNGTKANISEVYITSNTTVYPVYQPSLSVTLNNSLGTPGGEYFISSQSGLISTSNNYVILPVGTYGIKYIRNYTLNQVRYTESGSGLFVLNKAGNVVVPVTEKVVSVNVNGTTIYNGAPLPYSRVFAYNSTGSIVNSTVSNAYGKYSMNLPSSNYTLYATLNSSHLAGFDYLRINSNYLSFSNNIYLTNSYLTKIYVSRLNLPVTSNVTISFNSSVILYNTTYPGIYLPTGIYTFSAQENITQTNYTGASLNVSWSTSTTELVNSPNTYITLSLSRVDIYRFSSGMISNVTSANESQNVSNIEFYIVNNGNTAVNLTFSSGSAGITASVNRTKVYVEPGQKVLLSANVVLPNNLPAGKNRIILNATYGSSVYKVSLFVNIVDHPGFRVYLVPSLDSVYGSRISIPIRIQNTGNTNLSIRAVLDSANLSSEYSWNSSLSSSNIKVQYFSTVSIFLSISQINTSFFTGTANLMFSSNGLKSQALNVTINFPSSVNLRLQTTGTRITTFTGDPTLTLITGIIIIAASVVIGLIAASARGRRKR